MLSQVNVSKELLSKWEIDQIGGRKLLCRALCTQLSCFDDMNGAEGSALPSPEGRGLLHSLRLGILREGSNPANGVVQLAFWW